MFTKLQVGFRDFFLYISFREFYDMFLISFIICETVCDIQCYLDELFYI
jgi:hypothetical protein